MNTYIMTALNQIKQTLVSDTDMTRDTIEMFLNEIEMIRLEIEQHISNMPQSPNYVNLRKTAETTIQALQEIFELLEEFSCAKTAKDNSLVWEIVDLIDTITY